jgi:hypothetical protein
MNMRTEDVESPPADRDLEWNHPWHWGFTLQG